MYWIRLIRLPNLLIVGATQYLFYYLILLPSLRSLNIEARLTAVEFGLFVLSRLLLAATGYLINDIKDQKIDAINKPNRQIVGVRVTESVANRLYWGGVILGFFCVVLLSFRLQNAWLIGIYGVEVGLLWAYSQWFKRLPIVGNLVVSLFCALVVLFVFWVATWDFWVKSCQVWAIFSFWSNNYSILEAEPAVRMVEIVLAYTCFAFFITFFREIIKDIEDQNGDAAIGCQTLPIATSQNTAKWVAFGCLLPILGYIYRFLGLQILAQQIWQPILLVSLLLMPILILIFKLYRAQTEQDFAQLSQLTKWTMIGGLVFLCFF